MNPTPVVALVRVSTEEQAAEGLGGLERQDRDVEAIRTQHNLRITHMFRLEGVSGSTVKHHPEFQRMLKAVAAQGCGGLVISSPDRLIRCEDLSDLAAFQPFGDAANPRLIWTAESVYDLKRFDSQILFLFKTLIGGYEKKQIVARTTAGKYLSRERGDKCADKPPAGCEFVVADAKNRTGYYRYSGPEAERIRRAFEGVLDQDTPLRSLAKELGFKTHQGMKAQLMNPIWTGVRESRNKREWLPPGPNGELRYKKLPRAVPIRTELNLNGGDPLISRNTFDAVQLILAGINKKHFSRRSSSPNKFEVSGVLHCACGQRMYSKHDNRGGKTGYYVCRSGYFKKSDGCGRDNIRREDIDDAIVDYLVERLSRTDELLVLIKKALIPADDTELRERRDKLRYQVEKLEAKRTRLSDKIAERTLSDEEAGPSLGKIRSEIQRANTQLTDVESRLNVRPVSELTDKVHGIARQVRHLRTRTPEQRKRILGGILAEVKVGQEKLIDSIKLRLGGQVVTLKIGH